MLQSLYNRATAKKSDASALGKSTTSLPPLADTDSAESEITPADLQALPPEPQESEQETVNLVLSRFKEAAESRSLHEREWLLSTAFARGNQWMEWRGSTNRLESLVDPNDPYRSYITAPLIGALLTKLKARATLSKPDVSVKPLTSAQADVQAAGESRDILDHYDRLFDRQIQTQDAVDICLEASTAFLKLLWSPKKESRTAYTDKSGKVVTVMAAIGDIEEILVPPFEIYPDPKARDWPECGWLIHAKVRSLTYIQQQYGGKDNDERGWRVKGENVGASASYSALSHMDAITGDTSRQSRDTSKNSVIVYECWEKPSARYVDGRRIPVAGGVLLLGPDKLTWPYDKNDSFPFVPLHYKKKWGSLWAQNAVHDLIPLQRQYNTILSRITDRVNTDKPTILVPEGSEIGVDAYQSKRNFQKITYRLGQPPTYQAPPPISEAWFNALNIIKGLMEDISGVHEVSNGTVPAGVTAGNAIELLQQSDNTQMAEAVSNIETYAKGRAEWELALAAQYYQEPRLVATSEDGNPAEDTAAARSFEALKSSRGVRVEVMAGSATPKTAAARMQQYMDMAQKGMFQPEVLPVTKMLVDLMGLERSDTLTQRIDAAIAEIKAAQPDPAQIEAVKGQAAQQIAQQQAQGQQAQSEAQAQAQAQQAAAQSQHQAEMAAVNAHSQIEIDQAKLQGQLAIEQMKATNALALQHMRDMNALDLQEHSKQLTEFKITGTMDKSAVVDAEKRAGFSGAKADPLPVPASPGPSPSQQPDQNPSE